MKQTDAPIYRRAIPKTPFVDGYWTMKTSRVELSCSIFIPGKTPRRRVRTDARGFALSGGTLFDLRGPYFLLPSNRRSIRKRLTKSRDRISAPRIDRLVSASPYPEFSAIRFSFQVS